MRLKKFTRYLRTSTESYTVALTYNGTTTMGIVLVSMPNYVAKALHKFQHPTPKRAQYAAHQWTRPNYGATKQLKTTSNSLGYFTANPRIIKLQDPTDCCNIPLI